MQRKFIVGDSWVYYKIYTGTKTSDKLLVEILKPLADYLLIENIIDQWFFIRYKDPDHHLRIRFHCIKKEDYYKVISLLYERLQHEVGAETIWNIEIGTYKRELERYGAIVMTLAEKLFFYDSTFVVELIRIIHQENNEEKRWLFALALIDHHLKSFSYSLSDKIELFKKLKDNFYGEFSNSKLLKKQISEKYRVERTKIVDFLYEIENSIEVELNCLLIKKEKQISGLVNQILLFKEQKKLTTSFDDLNSTFIHMSMNRLFPSKNRQHELIIYDFLYHYYTTQAKLKKHFDS